MTENAVAEFLMKFLEFPLLKHKCYGQYWSLGSADLYNKRSDVKIPQVERCIICQKQYVTDALLHHRQEFW